MTFKIGQIVSADRGGDAWLTRVLGPEEFDGKIRIAVPCRGGRGSRDNNPCHAEWTYYKNTLQAVDAEDWTDASAWRPGMEVRIVLDDDVPQYPKGTILNAVIEAPHIEPEDWYVSFEVSNVINDMDQCYTTTGETWERPDRYRWRFKRVVNERDFVL